LPSPCSRTRFAGEMSLALMNRLNNGGLNKDSSKIKSFIRIHFLWREET
jgi:hypothetical protein